MEKYNLFIEHKTQYCYNNSLQIDVTSDILTRGNFSTQGTFAMSKALLVVTCELSILLSSGKSPRMMLNILQFRK